MTPRAGESVTFLYNTPHDFASEAADGVAFAHPDLVRRVDGGMLAVDADPSPRVSIVVGGGSGHFPAFAGMIGPGLADGAVLGNTFASPSERQVVSVAERANRGEGVVLMFGNYTGDVLHFTAAAQRLESMGIPCRTVAVTDDIASAPPSRRSERRGIAGDLPVFKVAAAAARAGLPLGDVVAIAERANAATHSLGVAFGGCTLPGQEAPLFGVPEGSMAIGMGIHGEPGLSIEPHSSAAAIVDLLVSRLLDDEPELARAEVVTIVNGLGGISPDELYVAQGMLARRLHGTGATIREALVGTFCSSFAMPGFSITLFAPDEATRRYWDAPVRTIGWSRPRLETSPSALPEAVERDAVDDGGDIDAASAAASALFATVARMLDEAETDLGRLDAVAGDGDHGIGMARGSAGAARAARRAAREGLDVASVVAAAATGWSDDAGGTSGAIWGRMIQAVSDALGESIPLDTAGVASIARRASDAATSFGGAALGDKTMLDAILPFVDELERSRSPLASAWHDASETARTAAEATSEIAASRGRARSHGEASVGVADPGAISFAMVAAAVERHLWPTPKQGADT